MATDNGLSFVRMAGVLGAEMAPGVIEAVAAHAERQRAGAVLLDYREADARVTLADISRNVRRTAKASQGLRNPAAIIVRSDDLAAWQAHSWRLCRHGLMRQAFDDQQLAVAWAAEMAALYAAQIRYRGRG